VHLVGFIERKNKLTAFYLQIQRIRGTASFVVSRSLGRKLPTSGENIITQKYCGS